ncbi:MAG: ATP-dependent RecD-like DNA helicase [Clostridia bacterium]|nr:ATP-dependent RecD-like DNA helicase [Clostridia bacterium]
MKDTVKYEKLSGTVEDVVYHNDMNDYTVLEVSVDGELVTAVGEIPGVNEGEIVELTGSWAFHKEFGRQFAFTAYEKFLPKEIDGILQYLSSRAVKGVGPVTALKIVNKYGMDTFDVIENHPEWLADIPGITMKKAAEISDSFRKQSELRGIMMFIGNRASANEVTKVYKKLGVGAVGLIKENPYILCEGDYGIDFERIDSLAASLGFSPTADQRIVCAMEYILSFNASVNGHTCLPTDKLISATADLIQVEGAVVASALDRFVSEGRISLYGDGTATFAMKREVALDEELIAERLSLMSGEVAGFSAVDIATMIGTVEIKTSIRYAELQRLALFRALSRGITVITGGPGTGKTTVVKALISLFENMGLDTVLCAPTGRAAKRLSEATGEEAKTVHRMLEMERVDGARIVFNRNQRNPLNERVIIVDEASMIDLSLMAALVRALRRDARLILIGDSDQLPSVGAGNVLADIIASGRVDTVCLSEVFRQSRESLIVTNAHKINSGESPILSSTDSDFFFVRREREGDIADTIASLVTERLPRAYGSSIREQIQVITPSKKGVGGVEALNRELQARLNPPAAFKKERAAHGIVFREGDRVMQTTNNYDLEWEKNGVVGNGIFNGDIGIVESIDQKGEHLRIWFDDRLVEYPFDNLDELDLSYAITVHKSQGSEYPVVIIPMYSCPPMLMTRNLLYTAVTRAKRMVILVGRSDIPSRMVSNNREVLRYTTLLHRLKKAIGGQS